MDYVPQIKTFLYEKGSPEEIETKLNADIKAFIRVAPLVHPKMPAKLERVSATQYVLYYFTAAR